MIISSQIISIWVLSLCLAFLAGWRWKNGD